MSKNIIITGASGLIASELIMLLLQQKDICLFLISTNPEKVKKRYKVFSNVSCFTLDEFSEYCTETTFLFKTLVHTAFSRSGEGDLLLQSIEYTKKVLYLVKKINVLSFINISSQSVYGQKSKPLWNENTTLAPNYMYALAKYTTEVLTDVMLENTTINYTSVRISSVCENARFLNIFVKNALCGLPIKVMGGDQSLSFIDVRDVAEALSVVIDKVEYIKFSKYYNIGTNSCYSILKLAELVKEIGESEYGLKVTLNKEESDIKMDIGMNSTFFMETFSWKSKKTIVEMIQSLFNFQRMLKMENVENGEYPISFKLVYGDN